MFPGKTLLPASSTAPLSSSGGLRAWVNARPLLAFFVLAFAGMWLVITPLSLAGLGLLQLPDAVSFILFILSTYSGPALAAFVVTGILEGKPGMGRLFRRIFQWRVGLQWYAIALFAFLAVWLAAYSVVYAGHPLINLAQNWPLLFTLFLPNVLFGILIPSLGEEPGWRGFALPRLQAQYGPAWGTAILGFLHGLWHLPAFFTPLLGPFTLDGFALFVLTAMAGTFIYTWAFNNTRGSLLIPILMHSASNAASSLMTALIPEGVTLPPGLQGLLPGGLNVIAFGLAALALIVATRGRLSYRPEQRETPPAR